MDREFLYLAVVCTLALLLIAGPMSNPWLFSVFGYEARAWKVCVEPLDEVQLRDCELRQALVDANLWDVTNE